MKVDVAIAGRSIHFVASKLPHFPSKSGEELHSTKLVIIRTNNSVVNYLSNRCWTFMVRDSNLSAKINKEINNNHDSFNDNNG